MIETKIDIHRKINERFDWFSGRKYDFAKQNFAIFGGCVFHFGKNSICILKKVFSVCLQIVEPS